MKLFYICTPEVAKELQVGWHSLDLGNGKLLLCVKWRDEAQELAWSSRPDVISLPHPIFQMSEPLVDEHVGHLQGRFKLAKGNNVHHMIKQAAIHDPWMRLHVL